MAWRPGLAHFVCEMRWFLLASTAVLLGLAAVPARATITESLSVKLLPGTAGTKLHPVKSNMQMDAAISDTAGGMLPRTDRVLVYFDRNLVLNGRYFPSCSAETLEEGRRGDLPACRAAKIGEGDSTSLFYDSAGRQSGVVRLKDTFFNGPKGKTQIVYIELPGTSVRAVMVGTITRARGPFGQLVTFVIPPQLNSPLPGASPSLNHLTFTGLWATTKTRKRVRVGKRIVRRKVGYFESVGCAGGFYHHRVAYDLAGSAPTVSNSVTLACRK